VERTTADHRDAARAPARIGVTVNAMVILPELVGEFLFQLSSRCLEA
jgi:hypothetical protein